MNPENMMVRFDLVKIKHSILAFTFPNGLILPDLFDDESLQEIRDKVDHFWIRPHRLNHSSHEEYGNRRLFDQPLENDGQGLKKEERLLHK